MPEADKQEAIAIPDSAEVTPETTPETTPENPESLPDQEKQDESAEQEKPKQKRSAQQRIDELTRARHDAEREAEFWRQKALANNEAPSDKPTPERYKDYGEYVEALTEWKVDQKVRDAFSKRDAERATEAANRASTAGTDAWQERQAATREAIPDYDAVIGKSTVEVAKHVVSALLDSEHGPEVAYHLAKNPEQARKLNGLSPLSAAREIWRIEASLTAPQPIAVKQVSSAPAPITPVRGGVTNSADPENMSMSQYRAMRAKQGARWAR